MPDNVRDNLGAEGFGYRWADIQNKWSAAPYTVDTLPGIHANSCI